MERERPVGDTGDGVCLVRGCFLGVFTITYLSYTPWVISFLDGGYTSAEKFIKIMFDIPGLLKRSTLVQSLSHV